MSDASYWCLSTMFDNVLSACTCVILEIFLFWTFDMTLASVCARVVVIFCDIGLDFSGLPARVQCMLSALPHA